MEEKEVLETAVSEQEEQSIETVPEVAETTEEMPEIFEKETLPVQPQETLPEETPADPAPANKKEFWRKWWFWAIVAAAVILLIVCITSGKDSGSSSGSGYSSVTSYVNPYVRMVKETKNSTYGVTYGAAFNSFFTNPSWDYFQATSGEHVVEFEGGFLYQDKPATATIQFVLDLDEGMLEVYHLSINGVGQNRAMLAAMVSKVFESY